jgi:exodeoxyribonuclease VII large subunit
MQRVAPEDGRSVVVHGSIAVYAAQGHYQLYADHCEPVGHGELYLAFERLKAQLNSEGLFALERKRPLPPYPRRIGVVTSPDAAALRDVCHVLARRWPGARVLVAPTLVQGEAAPAGIVSALRAAGRAGVDVVLLVRGGGSLEDLWAFNDETVARAIAASVVPVVSGVGHETDFTIADLVADARAPTPSAAAEICTPDGRELALFVDRCGERLVRLATLALRARAGAVHQAVKRLEAASPLRRLERQAILVAERRARLDRAAYGRVRLHSASLAGLECRLAALGPGPTLARGYSRVSRRLDGRTVRSVADVSPGDELTVTVHDGCFDALVGLRPQGAPRKEI